MNNYIDPELRQQLRLAKTLAVNRFFGIGFPSVVGIGIGKKLVKGDPTDSWCVRIYVERKQELDLLGPASVMPPTIRDVPTDVIEIGGVGRLRPVGRAPNLSKTPGPGASIGFRDDAANVNQAIAGTLGAVVQDLGGKKYILGSNHILAMNGRVPRDTPIVSPALADVFRRAEASPIAKRDDFIELTRDKPNHVDCALARLNKGADVSARFQEIGKLPPAPGQPKVGREVAKIGRMTGRTAGTIVDVDADFFVDYSFGTFHFVDQVLIEGKDGKEFAKDGDSGAVVVDVQDRDKQAAAMVFASAGKFTLACPLTEVVNQFKELHGVSLSLNSI